GVGAVEAGACGAGGESPPSRRPPRPAGRVLALELLDALQLGDRRPGVLRAPQEISRPTDAVATQQVRHRDPRLTFLQDRDDLPPRTATSASSLPDQLTAGEHNNREPFSVALRGRTPIERLGDFQIAA